MTDFIKDPALGSERGSADPEAGRAEPPPIWRYREVFTLVAVAILAQMAALAGAVAIAQRRYGLAMDEISDLLGREPRLAVPLQLVMWLPALGYIVYVVKHRYAMPLREGLAWVRLPKPARSYLRAGALLALGSVLASVVLSDPTQVSPMQDLLANREALWILGGFGVLVAPWIEEIVFRGFLYAAFERAHGRWVALVVTSAIFAALHGSQYGWHWQQLSILLAVGATFGLVRMRSGSTKATTLVHAAYNGLLFLVVLSVPGGLS